MLDNVFPIIADWMKEVAVTGSFISLLALCINMWFRALRGKETIF